MELTKEQAQTLEDVFNWAINLLEEENKKGCIIVENNNGEFERFDVKKKVQEITDLFNYFKDKIKVV